MAMVRDVADADREMELQLRSEIKHSLASPVRGLSILTDLLAESLALESPDVEALREISEQLTMLTGEATNRLTDFSSGAVSYTHLTLPTNREV